jgi:hypothetical protein
MARHLWSLAAALALAPAAAAESDPASVKKTVEKGGENWSSPAEITVGETTVAPGKRLLFWPEQDDVYDARLANGSPSAFIGCSCPARWHSRRTRPCG